MTRCLLCVLVLVASWLVIAPASAEVRGNPNPRVVPPAARVQGLSYSQWGDRWWQWALSIPADESAVTDMTGERAAVGQSGNGNVFFLSQAGVGLPPYHGVADRTITIPAGTFLFIPAFDMWFPQLPSPDCICPMDHDDALTYLTGCLATCLDSLYGITTSEVSVDGAPLQDLPRYWVTSTDFFTVSYAADNPWAANWGDAWPGAGTTDHNLQAGCYVMLTPLPPGMHTVVTSASVDYGAAGMWRSDATYHITVQ